MKYLRDQPIKQEEIQSTLQSPPYIQPMVLRCRVIEVKEEMWNGKRCKVGLTVVLALGDLPFAEESPRHLYL
jgi:hypothetical protein